MFQNIFALDPKDDDFVVLSGDEDEDGGDDDEEEEEDEENRMMKEMAEKFGKLSDEFELMKAKMEKLEQASKNKKRRCRKNVSS